MNGERAISCDLVQGHLFEFRDGGLDLATAEAVQGHLAACAACRATAAFDSRLTNLLRADAAEPPITLIAEVRSRVRRSRKWVTAASYATAAAVLVAGALGVWRPWAGTGQTIVETHHVSRPPAADDLIEVATLFEPPPVDSLDVLARQQRGYVTVLHRLGEE